MPSAELTLCPDCGHSIPRDAVRGICMACMASAVFGGDDSLDIPGQSNPSGRAFGTWILVSKAGEGAFGLVYEAVQERPLHRKAALKVLKPGLDSREVMARFAIEREAMQIPRTASLGML